LTKIVKWNLSVYVEDGPTLTSSEDFNAEAVDVVSVKVNKATNATVDVQPGDLPEVKFIYIKSDLPGKVKYKFKSGADPPSAEVTLDKDHILTSVELVALFKVSPKQIIFTNSDVAKDANLQVVVARSAV
jgi:hypothetical protein